MWPWGRWRSAVLSRRAGACIRVMHSWALMSSRVALGVVVAVAALVVVVVTMVVVVAAAVAAVGVRGASRP